MNLRELSTVKKYIELNKHHAPQTVGGEVLLKRGNITIELNSNRIVITDGWLTAWCVLYDHAPSWGCDWGVGAKYIIDRMNRIASDYYNTVNNKVA